MGTSLSHFLTVLRLNSDPLNVLTTPISLGNKSIQFISVISQCLEFVIFKTSVGWGARVGTLLLVYILIKNIPNFLFPECEFFSNDATLANST